MFFSSHNNQARSFRTRPAHLSKRRGGQAVVEFAFVLPIFVALILGVVQYGMLAQATEIVTNLTRDGARFASIGARQKDDDIKKFVLEQANETVLRRPGETVDGDGNPKNDDFSIVITPEKEEERVKGTSVKVVVTYNLRRRIFLPITGTLLSGFPKNDGEDPLYVSTSIMRIVN